MKLNLRNTNESTHGTEQKSLFSPLSSGTGIMDINNPFSTVT